MDFLFFISALGVGGIAAWQVFNWIYGKKIRDNREQLRRESTLLLERIEKVFKVVVAEGYFTEIYDHNSKKDFWGLFQINKKALVVSRAKVSVGFDFGKMKVMRDETTRKLIIEDFPQAEVLSIDTDYKFYDIDQGWLNKFSHEDYTNILNEAKKLMQEKALESDLPKVANRQVGLMMNQLAASVNWEIDYKQLKTNNKKELSEFTEFQEINNAE
ncbi:DUF4230 domain-containing protein [Emticicia sp. C21]|uniref:DUF4230 domain-containing protein n=1 Tax=Emticicia sp. C21 TaxID=2302915 RepID=UPI000E340C51|nr:DUF4230 domain-containing protein [Emticicia sp. C21]RFS18510.1 DUF4230 domain-containing protein [Emticicia sp. C21]